MQIPETIKKFWWDKPQQKGGQSIMDRWDRKTGFCCATCAHYAPKDEEKGRCRRHAPTIQGYPVVYADTDWCGDHKIGSNPSKVLAMQKIPGTWVHQSGGEVK